MANLPGPWQVRILYSVLADGQTTEHRQDINCDVETVGAIGDPFSAFTLKRKATTAIAADTGVNEYLGHVDDAFNVNTSWINAELWKYNIGTTDAVWYSTLGLSQVGISVSAPQTTGQAILSFRTAGGGHAYLHFMESIAVPGAEDFPPVSAEFQDIADWAVGNSSWIIGRDNAYLANLVKLNPGRNEALFKKRFRSA